MEKSTNFVVIDRNDTYQRSAAEQPKKSVSESFQKDGQEVKSQARSLLNEDTEEYSKFLVEIAHEAEKLGTRRTAKSFKEAMKIPAKSGFAMARLV